MNTRMNRCVCVCIYIYIYIYITFLECSSVYFPKATHTWMRKYTHIHTYIYTQNHIVNVQRYACMHACMYANVLHVYVCGTHTHTYICIYINTHADMNMYVCMYVCMYASTCTPPEAPTTEPNSRNRPTAICMRAYMYVCMHVNMIYN